MIIFINIIFYDKRQGIFVSVYYSTIRWLSRTRNWFDRIVPYYEYAKRKYENEKKNKENYRCSVYYNIIIIINNGQKLNFLY